jgi:hypothetical protein
MDMVRRQFESQLDAAREQHKLTVSLLESSYQSRIKLMEERGVVEPDVFTQVEKIGRLKSAFDGLIGGQEGGRRRDDDDDDDEDRRKPKTFLDRIMSLAESPAGERLVEAVVTRAMAPPPYAVQQMPMQQMPAPQMPAPQQQIQHAPPPPAPVPRYRPPVRQQPTSARSAAEELEALLAEEGDEQGGPEPEQQPMQQPEQQAPQVNEEEQARMIVRGLAQAAENGIPVEQVVAELRAFIPAEVCAQLAATDPGMLVSQAVLLEPDAKYLATEPGIAYVSQVLQRLS